MDELKDPFRLEPLRRAILNVFFEIRKICENHGLRYWVAFGSALGAVRHHGFIPWDDDFDIAMPREDYEKLLILLDKELPSYYKLVTWRNSPELAPNMFSKVQDCRHDIVAQIEVSSGRTLPQGVYVDIFPIDGVPKSRLLQKLAHVEGLILMSVISSYNGFQKKNIKSKVARLLGCIFRGFTLFLISRKQLMTYFEWRCKRIKFDDSELVGFCYLGFPWCIFPRSAVKSLTNVIFNDFEVPIPGDYDIYLQCRYGDYMKLPPIELQKPTHGENMPAAWKYGPTNKRG